MHRIVIIMIDQFCCSIDQQNDFFEFKKVQNRSYSMCGRYENQSSSRNLLQFSQCSAWLSIVCWKPFLWVSFSSFFFLSYLVKNSIYRVSVVCKLAMKWYLMLMCLCWLCPLNSLSFSKLMCILSMKNFPLIS